MIPLNNDDYIISEKNQVLINISLILISTVYEIEL